MSTEPLRIYLERIDAAQNVRRFYYAFVGPTFCGPICVVRIHGRLGVWQRTLPPLVFPGEAAAVRWLDRQRRRKLRRGYVAPAPAARPRARQVQGERIQLAVAGAGSAGVRECETAAQINGYREGNENKV